MPQPAMKRRHSDRQLISRHARITYVQGQKYPRQAFNADPAKDITKLPYRVVTVAPPARPRVASAILENARGALSETRLSATAPCRN